MREEAREPLTPARSSLGQELWDLAVAMGRARLVPVEASPDVRERAGDIERDQERRMR